MSFPMRPTRRVPLALALCLSWALRASAQDAPLRQDLTAIPVTRSFNLVGIGVGLLPAFSGSEDFRAQVLPVVRVDWRDRLYVNVLQAGAWLWDSDGQTLRIGVAIEPRFGYRSEDGDRVAGMQDRQFTFEGGPNIQWRTPIGVAYLNWYQDLGGASNGQSAQVQLIRSLVTGKRLFLNGSIGLAWSSARLNDYYFGVRPIEATANRQAYVAGATTNATFGVNGAWRVSDRQSVLFGAVGSVLGNEAANSPIAETRLQTILYLAYGWSL